MKFKGYALGLLSSISYGLIPLFILPIKQANFSLDTTLFYRFLFSALIVGTYLILRKQSIKVEIQQIPLLIILGILYGISSDSLFLAYDYLSAGVASTLLFIYPLIVAIIMAVFFKEKITKITLLAIACVLIGVIFLSFKNGHFDLNVIGLVIVLISALAYSSYIVIVNKSNVKNIKGFTLTFYSFIVTVIYYAIKMLINKDSFVLPSIDLAFNFFTFALVTTVVSSLALVFAIKEIGSTATSILGAFEPVVAVAVSVLLFNEDFSFTLGVGIICIIIGVLIKTIFEENKKVEN